MQDPAATAAFLGLTLATTKQQLLRAVLESVAFSQNQLVDAFLSGGRGELATKLREVSFCQVASSVEEIREDFICLVLRD